MGAFCKNVTNGPEVANKDLAEEGLMKKELKLKICRVCALIWICTFPVAFGTIAITGGDFTQLGFLLEQPHLSENYVVIKTILNIGLNLHIITALPSAFAYMNLRNGNKPTN